MTDDSVKSLELADGYDPAGNLTSGTDPTGAITHYELDATGRITKITDPDGVMVIQNTYGADGRVSHQSTASGADTTFSYGDETGRTMVTDATTGGRSFTCTTPMGVSQPAERHYLANPGRSLTT